LSTVHDTARFSIAPGSVVIVRDEEWLVTGVEQLVVLGGGSG